MPQSSEAKKPFTAAKPVGLPIRAMFSAVAPKYDFLNRVLSFGLDRSWRQKAVRQAGIRAGSRILDLCAGTGDSSLILTRECANCRVYAVDFSFAMLQLAASKFYRLQAGRIDLLCADILSMPFRPGSFDVVFTSFGLRNLADYCRGISQIYGMLKSGGSALILEFSPSSGNLIGKIADAYIKFLLPRIASIFGGRPTAYSYLSSSINSFLRPEAILACMAKEGLTGLKRRNVFCGVVNYYYGRKP